MFDTAAFLKSATAQTVAVTLENGQSIELKAEPRQLSTGSAGYYANAKLPCAAKSVEAASLSVSCTYGRKSPESSINASVNGKGIADGRAVQVSGNVTKNNTKAGSKKQPDGSYQLGICLTVIGSKPAA